jgi:hypothetical protein
MKLPFRIISKFHYETMLADNKYRKKYILRWLTAEEKIKKLEAQIETLKRTSPTTLK